MSQEITDDFIELARYYAQAEKELDILLRAPERSPLRQFAPPCLT